MNKFLGVFLPEIWTTKRSKENLRSKENCAKCNRKIPPGKAGRECDQCRKKIDFTCGVLCDVAPDPPARAVCYEHCPGHEFEYEPGESGWFCSICFEPAPPDLFED